MADLVMHTLIARDFTAAGIKLPVGAQRALDIHDTALTTASARPADELVDALNDGTLTAQNVGERVVEAATQQLAREKAHELLRDMQHALARTFSTAIRDDSDRILRDLRKQFTGPAKVLQRAGEMFPVEASGEDVLSAGEQASATWRELKDARTALDRVRSIRQALMNTYGIGRVEPEVLAYVKGVNSEQAQQHAKSLWNSSDVFVGGRWHALTAAGFTLHLASPDDVGATHAAISAAAQAEADRLRELQAEQVRQDMRMWPAFPVLMSARVAPDAA